MAIVHAESIPVGHADVEDFDDGVGEAERERNFEILTFA